jgi:hypothetical protein
MEIIMKENLKIIDFMVRENLFFLMELLLKVGGKMGSLRVE